MNLGHDTSSCSIKSSTWSHLIPHENFTERQLKVMLEWVYISDNDLYNAAMAHMRNYECLTKLKKSGRMSTGGKLRDDPQAVYDVLFDNK
jgi:hypothetical protein